MAIGSIFLAVIMGPCKGIGSIDWEKHWAHSRVLAAFLGFLVETLDPFVAIGSIFLAAIMGPCKGIGNIVWEKQWAHSRVSAAFFWRR